MPAQLPPVPHQRTFPPAPPLSKPLKRFLWVPNPSARRRLAKRAPSPGRVLLLHIWDKIFPYFQVLRKPGNAMFPPATHTLGKTFRYFPLGRKSGSSTPLPTPRTANRISLYCPAFRKLYTANILRLPPSLLSLLTGIFHFPAASAVSENVTLPRKPERFTPSVA